jgi:hypothetical protein
VALSAAQRLAVGGVSVATAAGPDLGTHLHAVIVGVVCHESALLRPRNAAGRRQQAPARRLLWQGCSRLLMMPVPSGVARGAGGCRSPDAYGSPTPQLGQSRGLHLSIDSAGHQQQQGGVAGVCGRPAAVCDVSSTLRQRSQRLCRQWGLAGAPAQTWVRG